MSRREVEARFPDDAACAQHLVRQRWPDGFVCPVCGSRMAWALDRNRPTWECAGCRRQTSVTAGTFMHDSHLPLGTWVLAAHIVATHSNGISALQVQGQLGIGSDKTASPSSLEPMAFLGDPLLRKLRRAMVDPERSLLQALVEIDETEMPFRSRHDPVDRTKGGRSPVGKIFVVGAVELSEDGQPRRIRLAHIPDGSSKTLHGVIGKVVTPGARVITDGWLGYENPPANPHEVRVVEGQKAHDVLKWVHRVFSARRAFLRLRTLHRSVRSPAATGSGSLKRWARGVFHGLRKAHVQRYLDAFGPLGLLRLESLHRSDLCPSGTGSEVRWNRRRHTRISFDRLLGRGVAHRA